MIEQFFLFLFIYFSILVMSLIYSLFTSGNPTVSMITPIKFVLMGFSFQFIFYFIKIFDRSFLNAFKSMKKRDQNTRKKYIKY